MVICALSLLAAGYTCVAADREIESAFLGGSSGFALFGWMAALSAAVILFTIGLARSLAGLLLKCERFRCRGANTFLLRQLGARLGLNAVMVGLLSFLIGFSIIGANFSLVQKVSERAALNRDYPLDIIAAVDPADRQAHDIARIKRTIVGYAKIEAVHPYRVYSSGNGYLHSFTPWTGDGYSGLYDFLIAEGDLNRLLTALGREPLRLNGGFWILSNVPQLLGVDFSEARLPIAGKELAFEGISEGPPLLSYVYFLAVVPDWAVTGLRVVADCAAFNLADAPFDAEGLRAALTYRYSATNGLYAYERCDARIREYGRLQRNGVTAIFVVSALYIASVFLLIAMAMLALKTLSGLDEDRRRYAVLYCLGAGEREMDRALFWQTLCFFFLPFLLPVLLSIPTGVICGRIMTLGGSPGLAGEVYFNAAAIALILSAIYALYFTATYLIARRSVIRSHG